MERARVPLKRQAAAGLFTLAAAVTAQAAVDAPAQDALEEIVVTATKRAERAVDVPAAISVIGAEELERSHAASLQDLSATVPGLVVTSGGGYGGGGPGQTQIILRGLSSGGLGALVSTVLDDAPVGSSGAWAREESFQLDLLPYDLERIEVLRGPQGTLYGANSQGGVLRYVTKAPDLENLQTLIGGEVGSVESASGAEYAGRVTVNAPLIPDVLGLRVSGYDRETPGYVRNPTLGLEAENAAIQRGGRIALLWQPTGAVSLELEGLAQRIESKGNNTVMAAITGTTSLYRPGPFMGDLTYSHPIAQPFARDVRFGAAILKWDAGFGDLTSISSYSHTSLALTADDSASYGALVALQNRIELRKFVQEVRLTSKTGHALEWLVGAFFTHEKANNLQDLQVLDENRVLIPSLNPFLHGVIPTTYQESAVFGDVTYRITSDFDITVGLRESKNQQTNEQSLSGVELGVASDKFSWAGERVFNYAVSPRYHVTPDTIAYARVATGYRPGVPNTATPKYPQIPPQTDADRSRNYEVGIKSLLLEKRLDLEVAVFKTDWTKLQISAATPDGAVFFGENAGKATTEGIEASIVFNPIEGLRLVADTAFTNAHVAQSVPANALVEGARLPSAPRWTAAGSLDYAFAHFGKWTARAGGDVRYIGSQYDAASSVPGVGLIPGYTLADLNTSISNERYTISLFVRNLANKRAFLAAAPTTDQNTGASYFLGSISQPRWVGLSVDARF